ncbi:MAG TPA: hypothetical protein DCS82_13140 [Rhodospirillaceae bacterium]|nr:hypothetical protein [Rhodospirillaceae bacterium]HAT36652.1 hypothetical protein [Rhodospirillaceae bacterium]
MFFCEPMILLLSFIPQRNKTASCDAHLKFPIKIIKFRPTEPVLENRRANIGENLNCQSMKNGTFWR